MDIISVVGILISLGIAVWQYRKAQTAESNLNKALSEIPSRVLHQLGNVISRLPINGTLSGDSQPHEQFYHIQLADVNSDGHEELIVQLPAGAHGSLVKVFARKYEELVEIAQLGWGTPAKCEIVDADNDGKLEIIGKETDWDTDLPYVVAPQMKIIYKWNGSKFEQVGILKDYTSEDVARIRRELAGKTGR